VIAPAEPTRAASADPASARRPRSLAQRLALWTALSSAVGLVTFAAIAYLTVIADEEMEPEPDPLSQIEHEARDEIGDAMLIGGPLCLLLAVGGTVVFTRRPLRPLDEVIHAAAQITPSALAQRLPVPSSDDEVRRTVLAFNALLERLQRGFGALDRFAVEASHEMRTPLAVVSAELEVMLGSPRSSAQWEKSAATCLDEVRRLTRLIDALLEMGRSERAKTTPAERIEVEPMIEKVVSSALERARACGVTVAAAPAGACAGASVRGDGAALHSALSGIVDNALQYTPAGGRIEVSLARETEGMVTVHIDDSGPGVTAQDEPQIFELYGRGEAGRKSSGGMGLGLSIARRICDRHGGKVSVGSSPFGGARFSLSLPEADALGATRA